jgi:hypothetical protein
MMIVQKRDKNMTHGTGRNESRKLDSGEIIYLVKDPGDSWRIDSFEWGHGIYFSQAAGGFRLAYRHGIPSYWKNRKFDAPEDAIGFVQKQIDNGKALGNSEL